MSTKLELASLLLLLSTTALAADEKTISVIEARYPGNGLQLEARRMPVAEVLDNITVVTGVPIHYSILPEGLVTATCAGTTVKQILECLFNKQADLIFRYTLDAHNPSKEIQQNSPAEVWVLGENLSLEQDDFAVTLARQPETASGVAANLQTLGVDDTDALMETVAAQNPQFRADAIAGLAAHQANDPAIHEALTSALSDQEPEVRAQAVFGLAQDDADEASAVLQSALQDSDVSVRLMAVDNAGGNQALLQQALTDSDETVRTYAAVKLKAFSAQ